MKLNETDDLKSYMIAGGNPDSRENFWIRSRLVDREVVTCMSGFVSDLLQHSEACAALEIPYDDLMALAENRNAREGVEEWIRDFPPEVVDWLMEDREEVVEEAYARCHNGQDGDYEQWLRDNRDIAREIANAYVAELDASDIEDVANRYDCWEVREVYEHWAVDKYLGEALEELGESVGSLYNWTIWGRTTTGQSISMDHVIAEVAAKRQILVGQKYSWEERT